MCFYFGDELANLMLGMTDDGAPVSFNDVLFRLEGVFAGRANWDDVGMGRAIRGEIIAATARGSLDGGAKLAFLAAGQYAGIDIGEGQRLLGGVR